ncbi:MAG: DNA-binding response regulator [Candidatus Omnitrophica bacterium CG12_big_fil_rev_8_21_14_0_65_43_15]|uniref:DNA-binding response regulator n=1 Tax=Candidatus Taenaricola geysiri TaxID=1974752 RepID=A0A2J0LGE4_9BACT|nr:MAG: DNA-binding response regulator [Candidatus Omnitrophica bacterium CG12_big_fil_rev_8_21_14_0_65_43_15]PIW80717.1 MAG: DNA-binding response regulator [Candidatus Omnitrophica bacterium CG_4_8_14_3_um_filter_43_15]
MKDTYQKQTILVVDDEKELAALVSLHMKMAGFEVLTAANGEKALELSREEKPDLIILDLMLPKIDGWQVCEQLRQDAVTKDIPVIMLTARTQIEDKLKGFEAGADDYVTKPFSPRELVARVKRVLARAEAEPALAKRFIKGKTEINLDDFKVRISGKEVGLTKKESAILKALVARKGELLTHEQILDSVWGEDIVEHGNIDVHIRHLREKIEADPDNPEIIKTIKGEGYKLEL